MDEVEVKATALHYFKKQAKGLKTTRISWNCAGLQTGYLGGLGNTSPFGVWHVEDSYRGLRIHV